MASNIQYEKDLNESQYEAVTTLEGPMLVIAGAGSGKTRTLTYRVARLVDSGAPPARILLLTFTRKASEEMLRRAGVLLGMDCDDVAGGTFHSFSHQMLRRYAFKLGFDPGFVILDRPDCEALIDRLKKELVPKGVRNFPRKGTVASIFSRSANTGMSVEKILFSEYNHFIPHKDILDEMYTQYAMTKSQENLMDFDDLLLHMRIMLATEPEIRDVISKKYDYIMVDEYQDTNLIQADILRYLGEGHQNVMVVGDDCQSIYGFRGANFENIMRFPDVFPGTKIIRLEENYRSYQPVLDVTNKIVKQATRKYSKTLFTNLQGGAAPVLVSTRDENSQSHFVVDEIKRLQSQEIPLREIAVLFRAGYQSFDLEVELTRAGIKFVKYGGFKFMESAHIKDALVHLRIAAFPTDKLSWHRALLLLNKVGAKTAQTLSDKICSGPGLAAVKPAPSYKSGFNALRDLIKDISRPGQKVADVGKKVLEYYRPYLESNFDNWPKRQKDLDQLVSMMERYGADLAKFIHDVTLEPPTSTVEDVLAVGEAPPDRMVLSTIHSAKGLEWEAVFVIWTLDGRFPSRQAVAKEGESLEEELRLMYVAATRAKKELFFVHPTDVFDAASMTYLYRPSRFLERLPRTVLRRESY
ncbi:ATP-dependent helicase [Desulfatibacillum aliphaticivorans]|uniref:ATP-dependent helicase n=1 Tax=Desulfatibacillum aliphaticivorans TaxID=218208 RepID=UPI0004020560|nr:ATP-dependent helicase [Desulfatibacillum aliphaticivorans]